MQGCHLPVVIIMSILRKWSYFGHIFSRGPNKSYQGGHKNLETWKNLEKGTFCQKRLENLENGTFYSEKNDKNLENLENQYFFFNL